MQVIYKFRILVVLMGLVGSGILIALGFVAWKGLNQNDVHKGMVEEQYRQHAVPCSGFTDSVMESGKDLLMIESISIIL